MRRIGRLLCILALMAMSAVISFAQRYPFLLMPGAPHGIYQMWQDHESGIWLGTIDDVYRFDGEHYYSLRQYGFPKEIPNSFAEDSDGGLWIATQGSDVGGGNKPGGLYRYQAGHVERELTGDGLSVVSIAPGLVAVAMGTEVSGKPAYGDLAMLRKSAQGWSSSTVLKGQVDHLTVDHQGNLLFPCPGGWCEISAQPLRSWRDASSPLPVQQHPGSPLLERVLRDKFGCVWMRAEAFGSYKCPSDPQPIQLPSEVSGYDTTAHLEEAQDGSILMLVPLALGRPGNFHAATQTEGLPGMDTGMIARDGTIWIGSDTGLYRFTYPFRVEYWDKTGGIEGASSIALEDNFLYTNYDLMYKFWPSEQTWRQFSILGRIDRIWPATAGTIYAAGVGELARFDTQGRILAQGTMPERGDLHLALAREPDGTTWIGRSIVYRVDQVGKRLVFIPETMPPGSINDLRYDPGRGILWACNGKSVIFRKDGRWGEVTSKGGLPNLECTTVAVQTDGDIWIGYESKAVSYIHNPASGHPQVRNFNQWLNEITSNRAVRYLRADNRDRLWFGTNALYVASTGSAKNGQWIRLDHQDWSEGDAATDASTDLQTVPDGSIWFSSLVGMTHFSPPDDFTTSFPAPGIFVAGFSTVGGAPTLADAIGPFSRDASATTAHIGVLQFDRRNAIHLRYRMLPDQKEWKFSNSFDLLLGKLRWGKHTLEVQAQLATGPWSPAAVQTLDVPWPGWLTWPAWLLYGVGGTGIGFGARQWWRRREYEQNLPLPDLTAWRLGALSPETEALLGTVIDGRYEIGHILSVGGFATVARARDVKEDALCAVKIFRFELGDRAWIRHRFEQEITALAQVNHPNIVRIIGHGAIASGAPYLAMEFIHGRTLRDYLTEGALERAQAGEFLQQLASALAELHCAEIFHRDLKPENLMVRSGPDDRPQIVLIDFSIAIVKAPDQTFHGISRVAGTLEYMAPEQVIGYADASTDIYSLAKVLLEMVTGLRWTEFLPEAKLDLQVQLREFFRGKPELFGEDSIEMIVSALAFDPGGRPKDVAVFARPIVLDLKRS